MSMRMERVASVIREEMGTLLLREINDPAYGFITVTEVQVTPDLKIAKVYVSVFGSDEVKKRTMHYLEEKVPQLRSILGSHLRLKFTPSLHFYLDETMDRVDRIEKILKQIHENDPKKESAD